MKSFDKTGVSTPEIIGIDHGLREWEKEKYEYFL